MSYAQHTTLQAAVDTCVRIGRIVVCPKGIIMDYANNSIRALNESVQKGGLAPAAVLVVEL